MTADRLTQGLSELQEIVVAPASVVAATSAGVDSALVVGEVATTTDSGLVLTGVWDAVGAGLELQATLEDTREGTVIRAFDPIPSAREAPQEAIATLRDWTLMAVQDHLHPILAWGAGDRFPDYEAYLMFRRYFETLTSEGTGTAMKAVRLKFQSVEIDRDFIRPRIQQGSMWMPGLVDYIHDAGLAFYDPVHDMELTPHQQLLVAMIDSRIEGRWENAFRLAQDEYERDPSDTMQRIHLMMNASFVNRPGYVVDLFDWTSIDSLTPDQIEFAVIGTVLTAYHRLGRHDEELALAREHAAAGPTVTTWGSARALELRALAAQGRIAEIDTILAELMVEQDALSTDGEEMLAVAHELRAHGFREEAEALASRTVAWHEAQASSSPERRHDAALADSLHAAGRHDEACKLFEELAAEDPRARGFLKEVGLCAARRGDRATAIEMETRIEEIGDPMGPTGVPYGSRGDTPMLQAGIAARLGERDRAISLIQQAIAIGYADYEWLHVNPDLEPLWDDPEFQEILRPKG
jgi:tetratricopeptide (TPR) repeat protein